MCVALVSLFIFLLLFLCLLISLKPPPPLSYPTNLIMCFWRPDSCLLINKPFLGYILSHTRGQFCMSGFDGHHVSSRPALVGITSSATWEVEKTVVFFLCSVHSGSSCSVSGSVVRGETSLVSCVMCRLLNKPLLSYL